MRHSPSSHRPGVLGAVGRTCYRHRWLTLAAWIVGTACLVTLWMQFGAPANNNLAGNDTGQTILNQHFPRQSGDTLTLAIKSTGPITSASVKARVTGALGPFRNAAHVTSVSDPYTTPGHISRDGHIAFASVQFNVTQTSIPGSEASALMNDARTASGHGVAFSLGGDVVDQAETPYGGSSDGIGIGAAAIVLLIAFGSLLAMGLPIITAVFGIGCGLALIALLGHLFPAPSFSPIIASMIGLGVGVDYALFIVKRFREALRGVPGGRPPAQQSYGEALVTGPASPGPRPGRVAGVSAKYRSGARSAAVGPGGSSPPASTAEPGRRHRARDAYRRTFRAGGRHDRRDRNDGTAGAARIADERGRGGRRGDRRDDRSRLPDPVAGAARLHRYPPGQAVPDPAPRGGRAAGRRVGPPMSVRQNHRHRGRNAGPR